MPDINALFQYVDAHFDEMYEDLRRACSYRSVAGDAEGLERTRRFFIDTLRRAGVEAEEVPIANGNAMIYGRCAGQKDQTLLFYNHYDVVEEGDAGKWRTGRPFDLTTVDGKMYARGVSDNKGALLSRIHAVQTILAVAGKLPVNAKFVVEGDEETSSPSMTRYQQENPEAFKGMCKADVCLWENGRRDEGGRPWARFGVRGAVEYEFRVKTAGMDVHSRMGSTVPSASWRLVKALSSMKDDNERITIDGFYDDAIPPTEEDLAILRDFPYEEEQTRTRLRLAHFLLNETGEALKRRVYWEPFFSICGLEAGEMYNGHREIVPHKAYARASLYLVAGQDPERANRLIRAHLDRHGFADVEMECLGSTVSIKTPVNIPLRRQLFESAALVYAAPMVIEPTQLGGGPANVFRNAWSELPIVGIGPGNTASNHHAPNENLTVEDYKCAVKHIIALSYAL